MLANGVPIELFPIGCFVPFLVLLLIVMVESLVSMPILSVPWKTAFRIWLAANALSALGGVIVLLGFGGAFVFWEPLLVRHNLIDDLQRTLPRLIAYYLETVAIEWVVWNAASRRAQFPHPGRIPVTVIVANSISYLLLLPLLAVGLVGGDRM
jgi:hypothetical protein